MTDTYEAQRLAAIRDAIDTFKAQHIDHVVFTEARSAIEWSMFCETCQTGSGSTPSTFPFWRNREATR